MNIFRKVWMVGIMASVFATGAAFAAAPVVSELSNAAPVAASPTLSFKVNIEWRPGIVGWAPVGKYDMIANADQDSSIIVKYPTDTFAATYALRAVLVGTQYGHDEWKLTVTRVDTVDGRPYSRPTTSELTLVSQGPELKLVSRGKYNQQIRDIRLSFSAK